MKTIRLLAFAGSTREGSFNKKLIRAAAKLAETGGHSVTVADLRDYALPLYDGDLEEAKGVPANAVKLKQLIHEHDAVLISSPEYNASVSAVLKNTVDWTSRSGGDNDPGKVWFEKPVALLSASPGGLGGIRALNHLRAILQNLTAFIVPSQFALAKAHEAFADDGSLKDEAARKATEGVLNQLARTAQGLGS